MSAGDFKVLCIGDSHTRGELGAPWVDRCCAFAAEAAGQRCTVEHITVKAINAGKNGEMACSIAARLPALLKRLQPSALIINGGTNDVLAGCSSSWAWFHKTLMRQLDPSLATPEQHLSSYLQSMKTMVQSASAHFCTKKCGKSPSIIVMTMPPISEHLASPVNNVVRNYNHSLQLLVEEHNQGQESSSGSGGVVLVDFYNACHQHILTQQQQQQQQQQQAWARDSRSWCSKILSPLRLTQLSVVGMVWGWAHQASWDLVSEWRGMHLLVDGVHFNDRAADLLIQAITPHLKDALLQYQSGLEVSTKPPQ